MKRLTSAFLCLALCVAIAYVGFAEPQSKCYLALKNDSNTSSDTISNLTISLLSKYVAKIYPIPRAGISSKACTYQVTVTKSGDTTLTTLTGPQANGIGDSHQAGLDGVQQSLLIAIFNGSSRKRGELCRDFREKIGKTCASVSPHSFSIVSVPAPAGNEGVQRKGVCIAPRAGYDYRHCSMERIQLVNQDLSGSDFSGVNMERARFINCNLSNTRFIGTNLERAIFKSSNLDSVDFSASELDRAQFPNSAISRVNFSGAGLERAIFKNISLNQVIMKQSRLQRANFRGASLNQVDMTGADLERALFDNATLNQVILRGANLEDANMSRAQLNNVVE